MKVAVKKIIILDMPGKIKELPGINLQTMLLFAKHAFSGINIY